MVSWGLGPLTGRASIAVLWGAALSCTEQQSSVPPRTAPAAAALTTSGQPSGSTQSQPANTSPPFDVEAALQALGDPSTCVARVGYEGHFERCEAISVANGRSIVLTVVTECGGDSCSVQSWLLPDEQRATPLKAHAGGGIALAPDSSFYVTDSTTFASQEDMANGFYTRGPELLRVDVLSGKGEPFAACMSPVLSPDDTHFVCRNRFADVVRVPIAGGSMELVLPNPFPDAVPWSPYAFVYPPPVRFTSPSEMVVGWGNARTAMTSPYPSPQEPLSGTATPAAAGSLSERLAACDSADTFGIATMCGPQKAKGFPALSADGNVLLAVESWSSCCADMAKETLLEFTLFAAKVPPPKQTLLWEYDQETGKKTLSRAASQQRIDALNRRATDLRARPLQPVPDAGLALPGNEILIAQGPAVRLLHQGRLVFFVGHEPFEQRGYCCNAEPTPAGNKPATCERQALLGGAWWSPESRVLVTSRYNHHGPDGCELGPRIDVARLPALGDYAPLRDFPLSP